MLTCHVGYDQAFANSGRAILTYDSETKETEYVGSMVFHPSVKLGHYSDAIALLEHLKFIKDDLKLIEKNFAPIASIALEGVAVGAMGQAAARGGIFGIYSTFCATKSDLIIVSPKKLKSFVTGSGNAEKEEIAKVLFKKYGKDGLTEDEIDSYDETDAIALADVGLYCWRYMQGDKDVLTKVLTKEQQEIVWGTAEVKKKHKSFPDKKFGICNRIDDFYIRKRSFK